MERIYVGDVLVETVETSALKWRYGVASKKLAIKRANDDAARLVDSLYAWGVIDTGKCSRTISILGVLFTIDYNGRLVACDNLSANGDKFIRSASLAMALAKVSRKQWGTYESDLYGYGPYGRGYYTVKGGIVVTYHRMVSELKGDAYERVPETVVAIEDRLYCLNGRLIMDRFGLWNVGLPEMTEW